jgi:TolB protein
MLRRFSLLCGFVLALVSSAQPTITIDAGVVGKNPKLAIASFSGPDSIRASLASALGACGWFEVTQAAGEAQYQLSAQYQAGSPSQLAVRVAARNGGGFSFTQPGLPGEPPEEVVYRAVDTVISKLFKVPGPCAKPIAFVVGAPGNLKEVFTCRIDGTNQQRLTHNNSISTEPAWGPNSTSMVYTTYAANMTSVILVDTAHNRQRRLSRFPGLNSSASLSPDGKLAALTLSRDQRVDLYLLDVAGGALRRLTQDPAVESSPCWSPDGREICYVSDARGRPRLFRMPSSGGSPSPLMTSREETVSPDWCAVTNRICFSRRMGNQYAIGVYDLKTGNTEILTRAAGDWESPSWAPDGRHIVCSRQVGANQSLYVIDSLLKTSRPLTRGGDHSLPSWGK